MRAARTATVLALAGLAGCAVVPTTGPIEQGPVVDSAEAAQFIRVIAAPPSQGASPTEIVRGFLEANASLEQDHAIARRYLTEAASAGWDPSASTTIYAAASLTISPREDGVRVEASVTGELGADGTLSIVEPSRPMRVTFSLAQVDVDGSAEPEWRITDPPPGVLISATDLRRAYRPYDVYHPSDRSNVLVPDGRLIPVVGPSLPTTLAELVLAGPAEWLGPGVRVGAPEGTQLALGAVPVTDGVARVELTEQALAASPAQRRDLAAQLTWTLTELPDVASVELVAGGEPYEVPGIPLQMTRDAWRSRAPDALSLGPTGQQVPASYVLDGDAIVRTRDLGTARILLPTEVDSDLSTLAVSLDERRAAAADGAEGLWLLPLDQSSSAARIDTGEVDDISFDVDGRPWVVADGRVVRIGAAGRTEQVDVQADGIGRITALQLARDGARVGLVADGVAYVGVVADTGSGAAVVSVHRVEAAVTDVIDLAWRAPGALDVIGVLPGSGRQVVRLSIGDAQVLPLGAPALPRQIAAAPGGLTLVAVRPDGVFANVGLQWREQGTGTSVAYPG